MSGGVKTRAMLEVGEKGGETGVHRKKPGLTKPATSNQLEEGEIITDVDACPIKRKRKRDSAFQENRFLKPINVPLKKRKTKINNGKSSSTPSPQSSPSIIKKKVASKVKDPKVVREENTSFKIDRMFEWFQDLQKRTDKSPSRSRSRSRTRSRSRGRSKESRHSSRSRSRSSYRSSSSRRSHSHSGSEYSGMNRKTIRDRHSLSKSISSKDSDSATWEDKDDEFNVHRARVVLGLAGSTTSEPPVLMRQDQDELEKRILATIEESQPKPSQGPDLSDRISSLVRALVGKSEFAKVIKVCDKYPRPGNVPELVTPELTQDVDKTVDPKVLKEDKRLKMDQMCATAATAALGKALDMVLLAKEQVPGLAKVGDILVDCITLTGFIHSEYNGLRLKGFKQTVNPSYSDIFSAKPDEPQMLMGKASISEQIKSCEELQKVKNKLKKTDSSTNQNRFPSRKGGEFRRKSGFHRNARTYYNKRRYDDRRNRGFSPRKSTARRQYHNEKENKTNFQEDRKVSSRKN